MSKNGDCIFTYPNGISKTKNASPSALILIRKQNRKKIEKKQKS